MALPVSECAGVGIAGPVTWAIITGEYPPQVGGVSDYTRLVAHGLSQQGDEVHVWAPACSGRDLEECAVRLHRLPGHFGLKALSQLTAGLNRLPASCRLLVEYVPHAFGWKAMNVAFCLWLASWKRQPVWLFYHEVAFPLGWTQPLKHNFLGLVTRGMASLLARASDRIYISVPAWASLLPKHVSSTWLPVPSTIPTTVSLDAVRQIRDRYAPHWQVLIGHFGTFGPAVAPLLHEIVPRLMAGDSNRVLLLLGSAGERFRQDLMARHPDLGSRMVATGVLPGEDIAAHLAACDVLIQPYMDGVTTRRTTLMAGFALGMPIVTTAGRRTEPLWKQSDAVALAPGLSADAFIRETEALLADPLRRAQLRQNAAALYKQRFAIANTIRELRS
jgi:glycosyltransferase involved in cell wall biosynthesis